MVHGFRSVLINIAGCLFKRGEIYLNLNSNEHHLSCGFMGYGCLAIPVRRNEELWV